MATTLDQPIGVAIARPRRGRMQRVSRLIATQPMAVISLVLLTALVIVAVAAPVLAPYSPLEQDFQAFNQPPSSKYYLGTDNLGRDILSRLIVGSRISLMIGVGAVLVGSTLGALWGIASGYRGGGKFDLVSQRVVEVILSVPGLIVAIALLASLGPGMRSLIIAISFSRVGSVARLIRGVALVSREETYIEAARAIGASEWRVLFRHLAPAIMPIWIVLLSAHLGAAVLIESSLSFLGLGIPPPTPSWGAMLGGALSVSLNASWWQILFPGIAISLLVLSANLFGDGVRDVLDPKMRGGRGV